MPTINNQISVTVTPEQFLKACTDTELFELDRLLCSPEYSKRLQNMNGFVEEGKMTNPGGQKVFVFGTP